LASLKVYINGLIAANRIKAGSVIKVYYQCGVAPPPKIDADGDGYEAIKDCDDTDAQINFGASEICGDSKDNNCDGVVDEGCNIPTTNPQISSIINAGLSYKNFTNSPTWKTIPGASRIILSVDVEGDAKDEDGNSFFSLNSELNGAVNTYTFSVPGGRNKPKNFTIRLQAFDRSQNEIKLKNNVLNHVFLNCTNQNP
jgi:hypothetical protein